MRIKSFYLLVVAGLALFSGYAILRNATMLIRQGSFFPIQQVEVLGLRWVSPEALVHASGVEAGASLVFVNTSRIASRIESNPRFKVEAVERRFPDTLVIRVQEKDGAFVIYNGKNAFEIDASGALIASNEGILDWDKLIVQTQSPANEDPLSVLSNETFKALLTGLSRLPEGERDFRENLSEALFSPELHLFVRPRRTRLDLGTRTDLETIRKARYALVYAESEGFEARRIDLRYDTVKFTL